MATSGVLRSCRQQCSACNRIFSRSHNCRRVGPRWDALGDDALDLFALTLSAGRLAHAIRTRLKVPRLVWSTDGNGTIADFTIAFVTDDARYAAAVDRLTSEGLCRIVDSSLLVTFRGSRWSVRFNRDRAFWCLKAVEMVLHVFPRDRQFEPVYYAPVAKSILPDLKHILPYLQRDDVRHKLTAVHFSHLAEVCLMASNFCESDWKSHILSIAEGLCKDPEHQIKLKLRRMELSRIAHISTPEAQLSALRQLKKDLRAFEADGPLYRHLPELILFEARLLVDLQELNQAAFVLDELRLPDDLHRNMLQSKQWLHVEVLRAEVERYRGNFTVAREILMAMFVRRGIDPLSGLPRPDLPPIPLPAKHCTHLSALDCETGNFDAAISFIQSKLYGSDDNSNRAYGRWQLALAEALVLLLVCSSMRPSTLCDLFGVTPELPLDKVQQDKHLDTARKLHLTLEQRFNDPTTLKHVGLINRFRVMVSRAMLEQVFGEINSALEFWDSAQASSRLLWGEGFTDAVVLYSKAALKCKAGQVGEARRLKDDAIRISSKTGIQYYITGLGTIWWKHVTLFLTQQGV